MSEELAPSVVPVPVPVPVPVTEEPVAETPVDASKAGPTVPETFVQAPGTEGELQAAPNGNMTNRLCDYFVSPRGCVKGDRCDFLHVAGIKEQTDLAADADGKKLCDFYMTERGCVKEDRCDFLHPIAPNGSVTRRVCEYFGTRRGCAKEKRCDFLHLNCVKNRSPATTQSTASAYSPYPEYPSHGAPAPAYGDPYGGAPYGAPSSMGSGGVPGMRPAMQTTAQTTGNTRVCSFYQEPRGCAKQERCDFVHQGPEAPADSLLGAPQAAADPNMAAYAQDPAYLAYYQAYLAQAAAAHATQTQQYGGAPTTGAVEAQPYPGAAGQAAPAQQSLYSYGAYGAGAYADPSAQGAPAPAPSSSGRVCSFFGTQRGCRKGERCDFIHPTGEGGGAAKPSVRYSPY